MLNIREHFKNVMRLIGDLEVDWDGEGSPPIQDEVMDATEGVFYALLNSWRDMNFINISPLSNGSIDLYWATRISDKDPWCAPNIKSQLLINVSYKGGIYRIGCSGDMGDGSNIVSFEGDREFFLKQDLASLHKFQSNNN